MDGNSKFKIIWLPILLGLVLATGFYLGNKLTPPPGVSNYNKISDILDYIQQEYVDTINRADLTDKSIEKILEQLDPHSAYIPAAELQSANEPLEGNFEGIGIEFHLQDDTIMVVSAMSGGPSEEVGIQAGDRIVLVDGKKAFGKEITNEKVFKFLRGKGGSKVTVTVYRRGQKELLKFKITRGKIPIYSIDVAYMVDPKTGYIKLSRFAATTYDEFMEAMRKLKTQGMQQLVLDLRGNPGGYLDAATSISDEFLDGKKLIVYTQGKARPKTSYKANTTGLFEKGDLVVLIDEGSASASEIVSGALQDWDRATIVGRRSFGKGLVQEQTPFPDGSAIRLTIARYYTPTGRSIQKPYKNGYDAYEEEVYDRVKNGELISKDSIHFSDSLKYKTPRGKIVYGGGGIMPDVFVPFDTTMESSYLNHVLGMGIISQFAYDYVDKERNKMNSYTDAMDFKNRFIIDQKLLDEFIIYAEVKGVKRNQKEIDRSAPIIKNQLKAYIARLKWQNQGLYPILHDMDKTFKKALDVLNKAA
jgi:carboxyl-terminal processing protease